MTSARQRLDAMRRAQILAMADRCRRTAMALITATAAHRVPLNATAASRHELNAARLWYPWATFRDLRERESHCHLCMAVWVAPRARMETARTR